MSLMTKGRRKRKQTTNRQKIQKMAVEWKANPRGMIASLFEQSQRGEAAFEPDAHFKAALEAHGFEDV